MSKNFYYGQKDLIRQLNRLALAQDIIDIPQNSAAAAASAAASAASAAEAAESDGTAAIAASKAEAALKSLDARYLGAKALPPDVDNNGGGLLAGATYWDTVLNGGCLRVFQEGAWVTIPTNVASQVVSTPVGGIVATNVQAALAELDTNVQAALAELDTNVQPALAELDAKKAARATTLAGYGITDALPDSYVPTWGSITGKPQFAAVATSGSKVDVGLDRVDNTADKDKPVSTAQKAALDLKASLNGDAAQDFKAASINGSFLNGMRNRIINGDMRVNQRNIPSAVIPAYGYTVDRWNYDISVAGKLALGANYQGWATPAGFPYYLGLGAQGAYTAPSNEGYQVVQSIEGYNLADLLYGSVDAKTCTLTAWVRSGVVGTHSGAISNGSVASSYPFTFNIPVANTWTFIKVTIPGDVNNAITLGAGAGLRVRFNLGSGSGLLGTAGVWQNSTLIGATGSVSVLAANSTFGLTGVQFEVGAATPFARRSIAEEILLCQRYYCNSFPDGVPATTLAADASTLLTSVNANETIDSLENNGKYVIRFPVNMRAAPTVTLRGYTGNATGWACQGTSASGSPTAFQGQAYNTSNKRFLISSTISARQYNIQGQWEANAEL
ncbi:hypothetical protein CSQ90_26080 [Janthinobacterium sp. BJB303]|nr:hypothetical protein CSQ90_26080 [Janthinobacterium sp. BJB303]